LEHKGSHKKARQQNNKTPLAIYARTNGVGIESIFFVSYADMWITGCFERFSFFVSYTVGSQL
jgi:hypothetical protein